MSRSSFAQRVIVDVHMSHVDVVSSGRLVERLDVEFPPEQTPWREALRKLEPRLRRVIESNGLKGRSAVAIYRSPTQAAGLESLAVASDADAEEAGLLGVGDQVSYASAQAVSSVFVVGRDATEKGPRTHVVAAVDHEDTLGAIAGTIRGAGLRFAGAAPRDALLTVGSIRGSGMRSDAVRGTIRFGESTSCLCVSGPGGLAFARRISIGLSALSRSLTGSASGDRLALSPAEAEGIVRQFGVPDVDAEIDAARSITGRQIRARLQSVLQRFVVEVRQSLRFGLSDDERQSISLRITGPGARLPGLADALAVELGAQIAIDEPGEFWPSTGAPGSDLALAMSDGAVFSSLALFPRDEALRRTRSAIQRRLWAGASAAMLLVALDGMRQNATLSSTRREADVLRNTKAVHVALEATGRRLRGAIDAMSSLEATLADEFGTRLPVDACLHELSVLIPSSLRLVRIDIGGEDRGPAGRISGFAMGAEASAELPRFVETLRRSPLFTDVTLGDVSAARIDGADAMRFDINFEPVAVPREDLPKIYASADEGEFE